MRFSSFLFKPTFKSSIPSFVNLSCLMLVRYILGISSALFGALEIKSILSSDSLTLLILMSIPVIFSDVMSYLAKYRLFMFSFNDLNFSSSTDSLKKPLVFKSNEIKPNCHLEHLIIGKNSLYVCILKNESNSSSYCYGLLKISTNYVVAAIDKDDSNLLVNLNNIYESKVLNTKCAFSFPFSHWTLGSSCIRYDIFTAEHKWLNFLPVFSLNLFLNSLISVTADLIIFVSNYSWHLESILVSTSPMAFPEFKSKQTAVSISQIILIVDRSFPFYKSINSYTDLKTRVRICSGSKSCKNSPFSFLF